MIENSTLPHAVRAFPFAWPQLISGGLWAGGWKQLWLAVLRSLWVHRDSRWTLQARWCTKLGAWGIGCPSWMVSIHAEIAHGGLVETRIQQNLISEIKCEKPLPSVKLAEWLGLVISASSWSPHQLVHKSWICQCGAYWSIASGIHPFASGKIKEMLVPSAHLAFLPYLKC